MLLYPYIGLMEITRAKKRFVDYYIEQDFRNASLAYQRAYPKASYDTARVESSRLLAKPDIQEYMGSIIAEVLRRDKIPLEKRLFDFWMRRAFYDITEIIDLQGNIRLTEEELREKGLDVCVDSINRKTDAAGRETYTYKFADKDDAADHLQQYIQMIKRQSLDIGFTGPLPVMAVAEKEEADDGGGTGQGAGGGPDNDIMEAPAETG
jgi:phage terminase small subunit